MKIRSKIVSRYRVPVNTEKFIKPTKLVNNPLIWSLLVLLYPLLNEVVFSDFVREGEYNSRIGWSFITALFIMLGNRRWITAIVLLPFLLGGTCDIGYAYSFGGVFTTATMEAVAYSDQYEMIEYIQTYSSWQLNLILLGFFTIYCSAIYFCKSPSSEKSRKFIVVMGCILIAVVTYRTTIMTRFHDTIPGILGTIPSYHLGSISLNKEVELRKKMLSSTNLGAINERKDTPQTHVFIIGESATRNHMGIYGYKRNTTPNLSKINNELVILDNVISSHVQTQASLRSALTSADSSNDSNYREAPSIIDEANASGYKTFWISNQQPQRATIASISYQANVKYYLSNDFKGVEVYRFDEYMLDTINDAINDPAPFKAIFIHMMGSHAAYENRYPEKFSQFNDTDVNGYTDALSTSEISAINAYDNSILYSDYFVNAVINSLKTDKNGLRTLTFFSDHGEEVFQNDDIKGHTPDNLTRNMMEIPFILWSSDKSTDNVKGLTSNKHKPFMLDSLFHYALDTMNIGANALDKTKSISSKEYVQPQQRKIYGKSYEKKFQSK